MSYTNFQKIKIMKKLHPEAGIYFTPLLIIKILITLGLDFPDPIRIVNYPAGIDSF